MKRHPWYVNASGHSFDWDGLQQRTVVAPYLPKVRSPTDMSNFKCFASDLPPQIAYKVCSLQVRQ